jgi:hypothetical protein
MLIIWPQLRGRIRPFAAAHGGGAAQRAEQGRLAALAKRGSSGELRGGVGTGAGSLRSVRRRGACLPARV